MRAWALLLLVALAGCELADADELMFGAPAGSGVISIPFDATQAPGCLAWDGTNIDSITTNPLCAGGSPAPTVTPLGCSAGYALQDVGATPGCVLLPTPDGAGAGAAATQTPWSCGAGNGARGIGSTPECFVVPTPDGAGGGGGATAGPGTPQPIATSTSAPGTADGFARVDHVHHLADGAIGPAKLSAAVPTPLPTATAVAFTNQGQTFSGTQEFLGKVDINPPGRLAVDGTACVGSACNTVILRDFDGNAAIVYTASTPGLFAASGTGVNRANDVVCTACIELAELAYATPTPVPTWTPVATITPPWSLAQGGTGASLTDPNADRIVFWDDSAGAVDWLTASTGLAIQGTAIVAVTPVYYATPTPVATPGSDPALSASQCAWSLDYSGIVCEGATANAVETFVTVADPTSTDKTITLPNASGTVPLLESDNTFTGNVTVADPGNFVTGGTGQTTINQTFLSSAALFITDGSGNGAQYNPTTKLFSSYGTGTIRANDVDCAGCVGTADASGLDISDDTNLAVTAPLALTGDTLSWGPTPTPGPTWTPVPTITPPWSLAQGGTGAALTDPNADRIVFWDDSAGAVDWLTVSTGLTIQGTAIVAVTPVYYATPTPVATPGSNPTMAAGQAYWADGYAGIVSEGATANQIEGWISFPDWASSDKTIAFPDETGTVCTTGSVCAGYQAAGSYLTEFTIQEEDATIATTATTLDFDGDYFDVTESPSGELNVTISASVMTVGTTVQPSQLNRLAANDQLRYFGTSDQVSLQYQSTLDRFMVDGEKSYFPKGAEMGSTPTPTATATATGVTPTPTGATVTPTPTPTPDLFVNILSVRDLQIRDTGSNITLQPLSRAGSSAVTTTLKGVDAIADAIRAPSANLTGGPLALTGGAASGLTTGGDVTLTSGNGFNGSNISLQSNPSFSGSLTASGRVLVKGHISTQSIGIAPTLSSCGTGSSVTGNDHNGTITVGTGATACTLTFGRGWANTPQCFANDRTAVLVVRATPTTTTVVFDTATAGDIASDTIDYWCVGRE